MVCFPYAMSIHETMYARYILFLSYETITSVMYYGFSRSYSMISLCYEYIYETIYAIYELFVIVTLLI